MKNSIYLFVLSILIGFSSFAFAESWAVIGTYKDRISAQNACVRTAIGGCYYSSVSGTEVSFASEYDSMFYWQEGPGVFHAAGYNANSGCAAGKVDDPLTGECKVPCVVGSASSAAFYPPGYWSIGVGNQVKGNAPIDARDLCDGQCVGHMSGSSSTSCTSAAPGTPSQPVAIKCTFDIALTGASCSGGNGEAPVFGPNDTLCANGSKDYPTCTPKCANGATDYPACTSGGPGQDGGVCANGGKNYPTCTTSGGTVGGTCSNGASNYPECTTGGSDNGTCANGASNYPTCTTAGTTQGACGSPGLPDCNTRIDERDTPTGVSTSSGGQGIDEATDTRKIGFGEGTKVQAVPWSFQFRLPEGSCSPISGSVNGRVMSMDLCPWLSKVRDAIAYLWYGLASIYLWKRVTGSTGAQA